LYRIISLKLGSLLVNIPSYRLFLILAAVVTVLLSYTIASRRGLSPRRVWVCIAAAAVAAVFGARVLYILTNYGRVEAATGLLDISLSGFSIYGALLGASAVGLLVCRFLSFNPWQLGDSIAPALGLGLALAKVGCFLNGCCFGSPAKLLLGVSFPLGTEAYQYQVLRSARYLFMQNIQLHPVQFYEAMAGLAGAIITWAIIHRSGRDGVAFLSFIFVYTSLRWISLNFRAVDVLSPSVVWFYPVLYAGILFISGVLLLKKWKRP
jgi:phosphatidylglycerol:prolipoprotein diacylglycerol transferase